MVSRYGGGRGATAWICGLALRHFDTSTSSVLAAGSVLSAQPRPPVKEPSSMDRLGGRTCGEPSVQVKVHISEKKVLAFAVLDCFLVGSFLLYLVVFGL